MSVSALVRGVEKRLRSADVLDDRPSDPVGKLCGVQPAPGRPPANFGQFYAAVSWGGGRGNDRNPQRHDVLHGVVVTLTARLNYAPKDRQGIRLATAGDLYDLADQIAGPNVIHGSWELIALANQFIPGTAEYDELHGGGVTVNGFVEPLVLDSFGPEREAGPNWAGSLGSSRTQGGVVSTGSGDVYVIDIRFREARRIRPYTG